MARTQTEVALCFLSQVFWFSMEFGVVWEDGQPKAYGAVIRRNGRLPQRRASPPLTSPRWDPFPYNITRYQPVLFTGRSMAI